MQNILMRMRAGERSLGMYVGIHGISNWQVIAYTRRNDVATCRRLRYWSSGTSRDYIADTYLHTVSIFPLPVENVTSLDKACNY